MTKVDRFYFILSMLCGWITGCIGGPLSRAFGLSTGLSVLMGILAGIGTQYTFHQWWKKHFSHLREDDFE